MSCPKHPTRVEINESENRIRIEACYFVGVLSSPSYTIDTLTIGVLENEEYDVKLVVGVTDIGSVCINPGVDSLNLHIFPYQGIVVNSRNLPFEEPDLKVYQDRINSIVRIENNDPIPV
jgi:hypothetical protein